MSPLFEKIIESKRKRRLELANLPFEKKIEIVKKMRDSTISLKAARVVDGQDSR